MAEGTGEGSEVGRLEDLWAGEFGDAYVERNLGAYEKREAFWAKLLGDHPVADVLEVGCNVGGNLQWVAKHVDPKRVYGVDVNEAALRHLRERVPGVNGVWTPARSLPFRDGWVELAFTAGVLIHQPELSLPLVMGEVVRASRRYVLAMEYFAEATTEVPYRGQEGALFKRDYGRLYADLFPELREVARGHLDKDEGWDDVTWWLFEKRPA